MCTQEHVGTKPLNDGHRLYMSSISKEVKISTWAFLSPSVQFGTVWRREISNKRGFQ